MTRVILLLLLVCVLTPVAIFADTPRTDAIVVSPTGNDASACTFSAPCQTLGHAQTVAQSSSTKLIYLRAGIYARTATLVLGASDAGETWMTYPQDTVNSAVLDGGGTVFSMIQVDADGVTIDGLALRNFTNNGIKHDQGGLGAAGNIHNLTVTNCDIGFNTAVSWHAMGIGINGVDGATIKNNYLHDLQSFGIALQNFQTGLVLDQIVVDSNVLLRTSLGMHDTGAIYTESPNFNSSNSIVISNNYIKDAGSSGLADIHDIYLDLGSNHVTVTGNVMGPLNPGVTSSSGAMLADGWANHFADNVIDLGTSGHLWTGFWWYLTPPGFSVSDNVFTGNTIISRFAGTQATSFSGVTGYSYFQNNSVAGNYTIADNIYYNYAGGQVRTDGNIVSDASPVVSAPSLTGWNYSAGAQWGPPGFVIPHVGQIPSMLSR